MSDLLPHHLEQLRGSGLSDATISAAGIFSLTNAAEAGRLLNWTGQGPTPAVAFPYFDIGGTEIGTVLRPDHPRLGEQGKPVKYEWAKGVPTRLYFPPSPHLPTEVWQDTHQPLLLVEGIKKVWAAIQAGGHGISAQGTWVWHDVEHLERNGKWRLHADFAGVPQRGRAFFIAFDGGDTTTNPPVIMAEARLARMLIDAGADVRLLRIPSEDGKKVGLDDFLAVQPDPRCALAALLLAATPADPIARARQAMATEERDGAVQQLVADLSFVASLHAASVAVVDGAAKALKPAGISKAALREAVASYVDRFKTSGRASTDDRAEGQREADQPDHPYRVIDGRLCRLRQLPDGGGVGVVPLANFAAEIQEDVQYDDGAELSRVFLIGGTLSDGTTLATARVASTEFAAMAWVAREWGARATIFAGAATRDQVRDAVQRLSRPAARRVYRHTGLRKIDGHWAYLFHGGAVGAANVCVELAPPLDRFELPAVVVGAAEAVEISLSLLDCGPLEVMVPLLGATYLAPVASLVRPDFAVWFYGGTGQLKSELAALAQAHFGRFDRKSLPASWLSTATSIEGLTFTLKDAICVIDDYAPQADLRAQRELEGRAQQVLRGVGNMASRGRARADLTARPDRPARGIVIGTGEDVPPGSSLVARLVAIEVDRSVLDLGRITILQGQVARLPHAMRAYIEWLLPQIGDLESTLAEAHRQARAQFQHGMVHLRQSEELAHLYVGADLMLQFAVQVGAVDESQADACRSAAQAALLRIGQRQGEHLRESDPAEKFVRVIRTLLAQGQIRFVEREQRLDELADRPGSVDRREPVGWQDKTHFYLLPEAARRRVATFMRESGEAWPHSSQAIDKALLRKGHVLPGPDGRPQQQKRLGGRKHRVLAVPRAVLDELGLAAVPNVPTVSPPTGDTPETGLSDGKEEEEEEVSPMSPEKNTYPPIAPEGGGIP